MAMSVAENAPVTTEQTPRGLLQQRAVGSFLGALFVLAGLWIVFAGLPLVWTQVLRVADYVNPFLAGTLLLAVCALAAVGLGYVAYEILKNQHQRGLRAGIFFAALLIFLSLWAAEAVATMFEQRSFGEAVGGESATGLIAAAAVLVVMLGVTGFLFLQPFWGSLLESVEDQGWFHGSAFKPSQGVRVRRGTVAGVLTLGICGIITLITHRSFGFEAQDLPPNDWYWNVPFTDGEYFFPLMFKVHLIAPVLLAIALVYFAWRLVNLPQFADFLIATEAEINKVSWTTRRRLIQDTIVVLVTVFLMTLFLFVVDIMWIQILSNPWVGVLQYNPRDAQKQQQEKNQW